MPDAKASGADTGSARSRDHNQGNQDRKYTVEQKAAVLRIRRCQPTAFYAILDLESVKTTCTESEIKKAYRKQSLLTHPDKNGHENADEAFKMVSRAFGVLGDKEKRERFDQSGTDPDSRFANAQAQNPFGFASRAPSGGMGGGMGRGFEADMTAEEMFARFFGGGGGGGFNGGGFGGPQFVFNMGGGPGIRVHQFGGPRPQRRPRDPRAQGQQQEGFSIQSIISMLPILLFFIFPLLQSLFSGGSSYSATPTMVYDNAQHPHTEGRKMPSVNAQYFVNPQDITGYSKSKLSQLDRTAENNLLRKLQSECEYERLYKQRLRDQAQGWFFQDPDMMEKAKAHKTPNCDRLRTLGVYR